MDPVTMSALISAVAGMAQSAMSPRPSQGFAELPDWAGFEGMEPKFNMTDPSPGAAKSAMGRTLEASNEITVNAPAPQMPMLPAMEDIPPTLEQLPTDAAATGAAAAAPGAQQGALGGMTSLELAQLGLMLGSQLFGRKDVPPPHPPGLPGSSFSPMKPVFRG